MSKEGIGLGAKGEELAALFLKDNGYKIIYRNYRTKLGEIDIIAEDKGVLCFVEVKARGCARFGSGKEAVSGAKQRQVAKAALSFLKERNIFNKRSRFDVVSVDGSHPDIKLELIKNAFELNGGFSY